MNKYNNKNERKDMDIFNRWIRVRDWLENFFGKHYAETKSKLDNVIKRLEEIESKLGGVSPDEVEKLKKEHEELKRNLQSEKLKTEKVQKELEKAKLIETGRPDFIYALQDILASLNTSEGDSESSTYTVSKVSLESIKKILNREGIEVIFDYLNNPNFFIETENENKEKPEFSTPAIVRKGRLISKGTLLVPVKYKEESETRNNSNNDIDITA